MRFDRSKYCDCRRCPLRDRNRVWGIGPEEQVRIAFFGEAPGFDEDQQREPFVGAAGKLLNWGLARVELLRHRLWISNLICCKPPDTAQKTNDLGSPEGLEALKLCRPGLDAELAFLKKKGLRIIGALGGEVLSALTGESGITRKRGSVYQHQSYLIVPTFHPSYIQRGQWKEEGTWLSDLEKIKELSKHPYKPPQEHFILEPTVGDLEVFRDQLKAGNRLLAADLETTSLRTDKAIIIVAGLAYSGETAISFPFFKQGMRPYWSNDDQPRALKLLREMLLNDLMFQNAAYDVSILLYNGFKLGPIMHDTLLAHHAIHPELPHNIGYIVSVYGATPYWKGEVLDRDDRLALLPDEEVRTYNLRDSVVLHQVLPGLLCDLNELKVEHVYRDISMKLLPIIVDMHLTGILLDQPALKKWKTSLKRRLTKAEKELRELAGVPAPFSFDSPDHMRLLLYGEVANQFNNALEKYEKYQQPECKLRKDTKKFKEVKERAQIAKEVKPLYIPKSYSGWRTTETGKTATSEGALLSLTIGVNNRLAAVKRFVKPTVAHQTELTELRRTLSFLNIFRKYRELAKLSSTYTSYPTWSDGRVHSSYLVHGTRTGRLASKEPNMQNIPEEARVPFVSSPGCAFVEADYSSFELAVIAYESGDKLLIKMLEEGKEILDENTKTLFGISEDHPLWKTARRAEKVRFYGRNYGGGLRTMYEEVMLEVPELELTFARFAELDRKYRRLHPAYTKWRDHITEEVLKTRKLRTAFGRQRIFLGTEYEIVKEGLDFPIQGGAADIINPAMIRLYPRLAPAKIVLQNHDAILVETPEKLLLETARIMKGEMEHPVNFRGRDIVFPVKMKTGKSWGKMEELKICSLTKTYGSGSKKSLSTERKIQRRKSESTLAA